MGDMTSKLVLPQDFVAFCEALEPSFRRMMSVHQLRFFWEREQALRQDVATERAAKLVEAERDAKWPDGEPYYPYKQRERLTRLAEQIRSGDDGADGC